MLECNAFGVLPGYTKDGSKCMCISDVGAMIGLMKVHPVKKVMLSTTYLLEQLSFDPNVQVCGLALLYDCENYSISLLKDVRQPAPLSPPRAPRCSEPALSSPNRAARLSQPCAAQLMKR